MAEADNIIVKIYVDDSELTQTINTLQYLGKIDKEHADIIKKSNQQYVNQAKAIDSVSQSQSQAGKATTAAIGSIKKMETQLKNIPQTLADAGTDEVLNQIVLGINDALSEAGVSMEDFSKKLQESGMSAEELFSILSKGGQTFTKTATPMRQELKNIRLSLAQLKLSGQDTGEEFDALTKRATVLQKAMGDAGETIKNMASDTFAFDSITSAVNGLVGGFSAAQGAVALFGVENDKLQETLVKLNALIAVSNGLAQVSNTVKKESAAMQGILALQNKAATLSISLNTAAESGNIIVKYAAIAAQKALNAVQAISPAGALALAIGVLFAAYQFLARDTDTAADAQIRLNKSQKANLDYLKILAEVGMHSKANDIKNLEEEIARREALGASEKDLAALRMRLNAQKMQLAVESSQVTGVEIKDIGKLQEAYIAASDKLKDLQEIQSRKKGEDKDLQKSIDAQQGVVDNLKASLDVAVKYQQDYRAASLAQDIELAKQKKELTEQSLKDEQAKVEARVLLAKAGTNEMLKAEIDLINKKKEIQLQDKDLSDVERKLIEIKAAKEVSDKKIEFAQRELSAKIKLNEAYLGDVRKGSEQEMNLRIKIVEQTAAKEKQLLIGDERKAAEIKYAQEVAAIRLEYAMKAQESEANTLKSEYATRLAIVQQGSEEELRLQQDMIQLKASDEIRAAEQTITNAKELALKLKEIDTKTDEEKKKLEKDFLKDKIENNLKIELSEIELQKKLLELQKTKTQDPSQRTEIERQITDLTKKELVVRRNALEDMHAKGLISERDYQAELTQIKKDGIDVDIQNEESAAAKKIALQERLKSAAVEVAQYIADASFQIQENQRNADYEAAMTKLGKQREQELSSKNLTERKKKQIQDKYDKLEAELKRAKAKKDKEAAIIQAIINGALAVTMALATMQYPAAFVVAALAAAAAIAQVAVISSQPLPEYAEGTEYLKRGKNKRGKDTIPIMANEGERIIPTETNMMYYDALNYIQRNLISPEYANYILQPHLERGGDRVNIVKEYINTLPAQYSIKQEVFQHYITTQNIDIDYEQIGEALHAKMKRHYDDSYFLSKEQTSVLNRIAENTEAKEGVLINNLRKWR